MEPYQYWTIAGFIFLAAEIITLRTLPLVLAGAALFSAVIAYKFPEAYLAQYLTCFVFIPVVYGAVRPYIKKRRKNADK